MQLFDLHSGDFFTLKSIQNPTESQVYVRGAFNRFTQKFTCWKFDDINYFREFKGDKVVYTDFFF